MTANFGYILVSSMLDEQQLDTIFSAYAPALADLGGEWWVLDQITQPQQLFFFVLTGGTEETILKFYAQRRQAVRDEPVFLIAHPGNNSLPSSLEVLARLHQDGVQGRIFYLKGPGDVEGFRAIVDALYDLTVKRALQAARIGLVGASSDWLVASMPGQETIRRVWGPEVVPIGMEEVIQTIQAVSAEQAAPVHKALVEAALIVKEPAGPDFDAVARVYLALKQIAARYNLDAITVRCFDLVIRLKTTGCFALSQLTDEGLIAGCEGDLVSTLGMLWIYKLLAEPAWMANPAQLDEMHNTLWLAHCTIPRQMVSNYRLRSHFETGLGVGIQGTLSPGPVTLLRIGGKMLDRLWLAEGEVLRAGEAENLCRTQAQVYLTQGGHVSDLLRAPLGNHLLLVRGHHMNRLYNWWSAMMNQ
ncbi:MAG: hypothetical protein JXA33_11600 [Anaerolineae bacterium]|nr:hypothetical protein [Anaerolineae bacterium]